MAKILWLGQFCPPQSWRRFLNAVAAVNQQGFIIQVNSQTESLLGYTRDELIGQKIETLVPEPQRRRTICTVNSFMSSRRSACMGSGLNLYGRRRDGSEFPVEVSLSPVASADGVIVLSAIRDISDRKRIEEELRRAKQELDKRKAASCETIKPASRSSLTLARMPSSGRTSMEWLRTGTKVASRCMVTQRRKSLASRFRRLRPRNAPSHAKDSG